MDLSVGGMERREEMPKEDRRMRGRRERRNDERWRERKDELVGEGSAESRIEAGRKELERGGSGVVPRPRGRGVDSNRIENKFNKNFRSTLSIWLRNTGCKGRIWVRRRFERERADFLLLLPFSFSCSSPLHPWQI